VTTGLKARTGVEVVVKHEKHTSIGAFKVREARVRYDRGGPFHSSNSWGDGCD
jgi:threonine dehydratase